MSLIITVGVPGSGKSTWADANMVPDTLRLERDRFRTAIFGSRRAYHDSEMPHMYRQDVIDDAMMGAMKAWPYNQWAMTDTGLKLERVVRFMEFAAERRAPIFVAVFDRPWEVINDRNHRRPEGQRVDPHILHDRFAAFSDPNAWWRKDNSNFTVEYIA